MRGEIEERIINLKEILGSHADELERIKDIEEVIKDSRVVESILEIFKETWSWQPMVNNQKFPWSYPSWILDRIKEPSNHKHAKKNIPKFHHGHGELVCEGILQAAFRFFDEELDVEMSLYKTSKNEGVSYGVVQVEVDGELALEFEVSNGLDAENYSWGVDGEPSFASIGQWISLILNLNEELKGSLKIIFILFMIFQWLA